MTTKARLALIVAIFLWASAFVGIRAGLQAYSPEGLALLRFLVASVCMAVFYLRVPRRLPMRGKDQLALMCIGAITIGIYNVTLNYGELSVSSGIASFLTSQTPIITAIIAVVLMGERVSSMQLLGFFISVCGVILIATGEMSAFTWNAGILYLLIATLTGGLFTVLQKPFLKRYHAIQATTYIIWGATLFLIMYLPKLHQDLQHASLAATLTVVYLGIFPAAIAYMAWSYALTTISATQAVSFLYFMPFIATLLGWLCLGEVPSVVSLVGGLVAITGVWFVNQAYRRSTYVPAQAQCVTEQQ